MKDVYHHISVYYLAQKSQSSLFFWMYEHYFFKYETPSFPLGYLAVVPK